MLTKITQTIIFLTLGACGALPQVSTKDVNPSGVIAGAGAAIAVEKVKEAVKPKYLTYVPPVAICDITGVLTVKCFMAPCDGNCDIELTWDEFKEKYPKVGITQAKYVAAAIEYCNANGWDLCIQQSGVFDSEAVIVVE